MYRLPLYLPLRLCAALPFLAPSLAHAQQTADIKAVQTAQLEASSLFTAESLGALDDEPTSASASTNDLGPAGIVPYSRGFNMSLGTTSQHDSAAGWSSILTPNIAYRFGPHFSMNLGLPVFSYVDIYAVISTKKATKTSPAAPIYGFKPAHFLLGDTVLAAQFEDHFRPFDYNLTTTIGMPTGNDLKGLGAGQATWSLNNHFEKSLGEYFTPDIELGIGNSTNLVDARVRKSYTEVGQNAHFQAGTSISLPHNINFSTEAFEDMPLTSQVITSTTTNGKKGKQLKTTTTTRNVSIGEDNGFLNTLDIPLNRHVTLSGFYNRSLRNRLDTVGFSFTFLLKAPPRPHDHNY